jgi:hypothetical protein
MTLPPKGSRSPRGGKNDRSGRGVETPKIFVQVEGRGPFSFAMREAGIRVRMGCYRYLVWRDGKTKREFYLGKVKNVTPQTSPAPAAAAARRRTSSGGKK